MTSGHDGSYQMQLFTDLLRTTFHSKVTAGSSLCVSQNPIIDTQFVIANDDGRVYVVSIPNPRFDMMIDGFGI